MLVRIVLFLGIALVLLAGGAAGYQYLQAQGIDPMAMLRSDDGADAAAARGTEPAAEAAEAAAPPAPPPAQNWLITPGGGLVDRQTVASYLWQDRLVERRIFRVGGRFPLADLLAEGETLPEPAFRLAFADIRAQALADRECAALRAADLVSRCEMVSAGVEEDSLDEAGETAEFQIVLAYALPPPTVALPDLSGVVLREDRLVIEIGEGAAEGRGRAGVLVESLAAAQKACGAQSAEHPHCRMLGLSAEGFDADGKAEAQVYVAWLTPMPPGLYPAPPLN